MIFQEFFSENSYTSVVTGKSAEAFEFKRVVECRCAMRRSRSAEPFESKRVVECRGAMRRRKNSKPHDFKGVVQGCCAAWRKKSSKTRHGGQAIEKKRARYGPWLWGGCQGLKTDGVLKARPRASSWTWGKIRRASGLELGKHGRG
jgi:hypothetical protein